MYRDEINVKPHDFAGTTTAAGDGDSKITIEGLQMLRVEPMTPRNSTGVAADGFAWDVKSPDRRGTVTFQIPENSPSNTGLWDLYEADEEFSFSHVDPANPAMKIQGRFRMNRPPLERGSEITMVEYSMTCKYLKYRGNGYAVVQQA